MGFELVTSDVVADQKAASNVNFGNSGAASTPTWLSIRGEQINREEVATSSLEFVMLPFAGGFKGEAAEGLDSTTLIEASDASGYVSSYEAISQNANLLRNLRKVGNMPLALRLKGNFKTSFPGGKPKSEESGEEPDQNDEEATESDEATLAESAQEGVVVLVADADMVQDRMCVRSISFFGQTFNEPLNDNLIADIVINFLVGSNDGGEENVGTV